jgi:hypothetical protein
MKDELRWSIHLPTGHCKHDIGLDAYIGQCESSEVIPILGPFSTKELSISERQLALINWNLTQELEHFRKSKYIVWGALSPTAGPQNIVVLDQYISWIPDPSARTNWAFSAGIQSLQHSNKRIIEREWSLTTRQNEIVHNSGMGFRYSNNCFCSDFTRMITQSSAIAFVPNQLDDSVWHSENLKPCSHALAKIGLKALCATQKRKSFARTINIEITNDLELAFAN